MAKKDTILISSDQREALSTNKTVSKPPPSQKFKWDTGIVYSCNYCDEQFFSTTSGPRHLKKVHDITILKSGEYSAHISFKDKKYSCKICYADVIHAHGEITVHMKKHNLTMEQYERKYESETLEMPQNKSVQSEGEDKLLKESTITSKLETLDELDDSNFESEIIEPKNKKRKHDEEDERKPISMSKKEVVFMDELQHFMDKLQSKSEKNSKTQEASLNESNRKRYKRITQIQNEMMMNENY